MNRRNLLKGMLAMPAISLLDGCRFRFNKTDSQLPPGGATLCVILQGPFAVVLRKGGGVTAFVPFDQDDPAKWQHEFRLRSPNLPPMMPCEDGYHFKLSHEGLARFHGEPQIDRGFDNVRMSVDQWPPDHDKYFVTLHLPTPNRITYIPPLYAAVFEAQGNQNGRPGSVPLNHVLEYTVRSSDEVRLRLANSYKCKVDARTQQDLHRPLSVPELVESYKAYYKSMPDQADIPELSERGPLEKKISKYSYVYFFGVGLPPDPEAPRHWKQRETHGVTFFNDRLLPAIYGSPEKIPAETKLITVGREAMLCNQSSAVSYTPAVWHPGAQARLLTVANTENCTAPGAVVTTRH